MRILIALLLAATAPAATLRYWIQPCAKPEAGCHTGDPQLAQWALEAWQKAAGPALSITVCRWICRIFQAFRRFRGSGTRRRRG